MASIVTPFPVERITDLYAWLQEWPDATTDDYGARTLDGFVCEVRKRLAFLRTWGFVDSRGDLSGFHACIQITPRLALRDGLCFSQGHFSHKEKIALNRRIIEQLFAEGVERIESSIFFAGNVKIRAFLAELGFQDEAYFRERTLQHGVPVDMRQMALLRSEYQR